MITYFKKGDTLIEVMFAVSAFAAIMIGGLSLMNMGAAKVQTTLELTMARNAIDAQAEALRYVNSVYISNYPNNVDTGVSGTWTRITDKSQIMASASSLTECPNNTTELSTRRAFIIDPMTLSRSGSVAPASTYPRLIFSQGGAIEQDANNTTEESSSRTFSSAEGIWIESVKGDRYYDFHIRACWRSPGSSAPSTIGTIVRLYDPAN